ncbi:hypothetical protein CALVIDRAFT_596012 [Calocera viscosa TUFC12733]|uniref:Zn(2)-C6 fungal-type domain-containing protein n=1 Tax=Calocera viscosa (strain TUFC12733) TaxID=1330018 RepID=A0A167Q4T7_CALVF|nr:hypothetical protein CALVIDRAFT_596012 [Calocera viscosa TUFC12733]
MSHSSPDATETIGQKRKQYSSCDTCKLRRVKCERESEDQACAKCVEKGIHCTTAGPQRKRPRTGKRIEQAKQLFGDGTHNVTWSNRGKLIPYSGTAFITPASDDGDFDLRGFDGIVARPLRRDSVDSRLYLAETVSWLSGELIDGYFSVTPFRLPLYRWKNFQEDFENAGRRPEQMAGLGGVIAHALIAYGAYASNSPAILGPGAPSLDNIDSEEVNFIHWGRQRAAVCESLVERAVRAAEEHGVFRIESNESILILLLLEILVGHGDTSDRRGRPFRAAALCHAQTMSEDETMLDEYTEMRGGGLGWLIYTRDTIHAAIFGRGPRLRDQDVEMLRGIDETDVQPVELPSIAEFTRALNGDILVWIPVIRIWDHITWMTRQIATRMAKGTRRPRESEDGPFPDDFWNELCRDLDDTTECVKRMHEHLSPMLPLKQLGHRFFQYYGRTNSLGCIFVNFLVHRGINQELKKLNQGLDQAYLVPLDDTANFGISEHEKHRAKLLQLKHEADGRMQKCARQLACLLLEFQNSISSRTAMGIITGVPMVYETFPVFAEILCTMPSMEEGGSADFPLETKVQEIGWLLSTFRSLGWSWADMADLIKYLEGQHARLVTLKSDLSVSSGQQTWMTPISSVPSCADSGASSFAPPTPESMQLRPLPDIVDQISGSYTSITNSERPTTGHALAERMQPFALFNAELPDAPAFLSLESSVPPAPPIVLHTETSVSALDLSDLFADLYTTTAAGEHADRMAQPGILPSSTPYEDLQEWESLFGDQAPVNWDFGHTGFSAQPQ